MGTCSISAIELTFHDYSEDASSVPWEQPAV